MHAASSHRLDYVAVFGCGIVLSAHVMTAHTEGNNRVPYYRLYYRGLNGSFTGFDDFEVADDAAAVHRAKGLHHGDKSELWNEDRMVATLMPFNVDGSKSGEPVVLLAVDETAPADHPAGRGAAGK